YMTSPRIYFKLALPHPTLHSFPTRRSSDLTGFAVSQSCFNGLPNVDRIHQIIPSCIVRQIVNKLPSGFLIAAFVHVVCLPAPTRSEEHTSELQSRGHLVCRLLLEKKNRI